MPRRPRVLLVSTQDIYPYMNGGMAIRGREFADLVGDAADVWVMTSQGLRDPRGGFHRHALEGDALAWFGTNVSWSLANVGWWAWARACVRFRARRMLAAVKPDLIYFNQFETLDPIVLRPLLDTGVPAIARFGGRRVFSLFQAIALRRRKDTARPAPLTLLYNCEFLRRYYDGLCPDVPAEVIYDGVDTRLFRPSDSPPSTTVYVFLGRTLARRKGFLNFCRAMAALPEAQVGGIEIIGDGEDLGAGLAIIRNAGRSHLLRRAGHSDRAETAERLRTGSVMVLPSVDEGLPAAAMEAMASGLAVVASDAAGVPEVVHDGETGLLVRSDDFGGLLRACRVLGADRQLQRRLGGAARAAMVRTFDRRRGLEAWESLVQSKLAGAHAFSGTDRP